MDNHFQNWQIEASALRGSNHERRWLSWCNLVQIMASVDTLDRDGTQGGYSLDHAYDAFCSGKTAEEYAQFVMMWKE